jgi:hypothetical protein
MSLRLGYPVMLFVSIGFVGCSLDHSEVVGTQSSAVQAQACNTPDAGATDTGPEDSGLPLPPGSICHADSECDHSFVAIVCNDTHVFSSAVGTTSAADAVLPNHCGTADRAAVCPTCAIDEVCQLHYVQQIAPAFWFTCLAAQCKASCTVTGCPGGETCLSDGTCAATTCDQGFACPSGFHCDPQAGGYCIEGNSTAQCGQACGADTTLTTGPLGQLALVAHRFCVPDACMSDEDCGDAFCINGLCSAVRGRCSSICQP